VGDEKCSAGDVDSSGVREGSDVLLQSAFLKHLANSACYWFSLCWFFLDCVHNFHCVLD
jgi:hypothetical protein